LFRKEVANAVSHFATLNSFAFYGGELRKEVVVLAGRFLKRGGGSSDEHQTHSPSLIISGPILEFRVSCGGPMKSL